MELNLEAKTDSEKRIKEYLEQNASENLADKINNGVPIVKDGNTLISKKTLSGFMKYASDEARKLAEKGAISACIEDSVVFCWAIHYFEEDSIEGTLYNQDGTEYKPAPKKTATKPIPKPEPKKETPKSGQFSLFDMMAEQGAPIEEQSALEEDDDEPTEEEIHKQEFEGHVEEPKISPVYLKYKAIQEENPDYIIAYRLGDFYEIFGDNAVMLANKLDLTLTSRDIGLTKRIPMIGFPFHASDNYFNKAAKKHKLLAYDSPGEITYYPPLQNDDFDLTESEMREFDGDIDDGKHWVNENTYVDEEGEVHEIRDDELQSALDLKKSYDKEALCIIDELLGELITLG